MKILTALKGRSTALAFAAFCTLIQFGSLSRFVIYLSTGAVV